jgi:hypothetical protein
MQIGSQRVEESLEAKWAGAYANPWPGNAEAPLPA